MQALKESEINQEIINKEDFKVYFINNWAVGKSILVRIEQATKRPLLHLAIKVLIQLGDKLYNKFSQSINITL